MRTISADTLSGVGWVSPVRASTEAASAFDAHLTASTVVSGVGFEGVGRLGAIAVPVFLDDADTREERRRKAIRRGGSMLDLLGLLQHATVSGEPASANLLDQLAITLRNDRADEDGQLGSLLQEIEVRVEVELARRGR